ncbi:hypothetical protein BDV39DRAFT_189267 [Aspergillus sergii]|uniref:Uncharacterized protein n=1 Tax=Aspergillus sergii TaxID=1034303 RepID=A0A5N6XKP6_9EURO|nr:hypothetical protein BDV39DRAFT_189267 [Aspergillus sergii]
MTDIHKHSSDLLMFRQIFSFPQRRQTLRRLYYEVDLPTSSARHKERDADDKSFEKGIIDLYSELSTWGKQGSNLTVAISSSEDLGRRPLDFSMGLEHWLRPVRDIYLSSDNADLPELSCIRSLYIPDIKRNLHPSVIGWIISSLPRIKSTNHSALAKALGSPSLRNLKSLYISLEESIPLNCSYETQTEDPAYPDGDALNLSIRKLAETSPLATLSLTGPWLISPALFNGTAPFPYLQDLNINAAILTYDGRWYYTGDPSFVNRHFQFGTEDTEQGEAMLNGEVPHWWRTVPDPEMFHALMKSMAEAMNRMPRLLRLKFCMAMYLTGDHGIFFWYSETRPARWEERRCRIGLIRAAKWEVPDEILELWRERVGWEGVTLTDNKVLTMSTSIGKDQDTLQSRHYANQKTITIASVELTPHQECNASIHENKRGKARRNLIVQFAH